MRWQRGHQSSNVEDRRGAAGPRRGGIKIGLGGLVVLLVLSAVFGQDLVTPLLGGGPASGPGAGGAVVSSPEEQELVSFVSFVLDDTQTTWRQIFAQRGQQYPDARLVLFSDAVDTRCGAADSGVGPFYCPGDQQVYIDLGFFRELRSRFGAPGDFAQAYVLAHEIGHHIQHVVGTEERVRQLQGQNPAMENELSVRMELQADCYAGVWAHSSGQRQLLEQGDVEEAMRAAAAIGDDTLQRAATGRVQPETWTHGSSEQRVRWFRQGLSTGSMDTCDTFGAQ